jgi:hypothetical protein
VRCTNHKRAGQDGRKTLTSFDELVAEGVAVDPTTHSACTTKHDNTVSVITPTR